MPTGDTAGEANEEALKKTKQTRYRAVHLQVEFHAERTHLPIVKLRRAARLDAGVRR